MWATVAAAFKVGSLVCVRLLIAAGRTSRRTARGSREYSNDSYQRVYDRLATAIWEVDPKRLVFFAGVTWDNYGNGFSHPPGGKQNANR
eukprot:756872-Hanusia_phi.AAC.7